MASANPARTTSFAKRFRSRDLILGYMAAFAAGDAESRIAA
jgi:hypothetical protein